VPQRACLDRARAARGIGRFGDAGKCVAEAITAAETTKERWWEAEAHRTAGEIAFLSPERDVAKAFCTRNFSGLTENNDGGFAHRGLGFGG
jgi:predicted ATPase